MYACASARMNLPTCPRREWVVLTLVDVLPARVHTRSCVSIFIVTEDPLLSWSERYKQSVLTVHYNGFENRWK